MTFNRIILLIIIVLMCVLLALLLSTDVLERVANADILQPKPVTTFAPLATPPQTSAPTPAPTPAPEPTPVTLTLSFAGDCTLSNVSGNSTEWSFDTVAAREPPEYFLANVADIFKQDELTVVNLECVISDNDGLARRGKSGDRTFWFKGKSSYLDILKLGGVDGVSISNNHINDYNADGAQDTRDALDAAGILYGEPGRAIEHLSSTPYGDVKFAVICTSAYSAEQYQSTLNAVETLRENEPDTIIITYTHGGTESTHDIDDWRKTVSRKAVDVGASLVLWSHPHMVQDTERYNDAYIAYSLGNFCYGGHRKPENDTMVFQLTLTISPDGTRRLGGSVIPCYVYTPGGLNDYRPAVK